MANINLQSEDVKVVNVPITEIEEFLDPLGFHTRAKYLYQIRDKNGNYKNYEPWLPQRILDNIIREEVKRSREMYGYVQVFLIYLKSRQEGLSTDTTLRIIDKMLFNSSYFAQVLAHDQEGTGLLFSQYERAFDGLPNMVQVVDEYGNPVVHKGSKWMFPIKPKGGPTRKGIKFENLTESNLIVQTAGKGDNAGKAGSLNAAHFSETANYDKHDKVISSVNQQLGVDVETLTQEQLNEIDNFGVKESTANGTTGLGEGFYNDWVENEKAWARYQSGESETFMGWRPVFLPWYWLYHMPLQKGKKYDLEGINWESEKQKQEYREWEEKVEQEIIPNDPEIDENERDPREYTNFYRWVIVNKCQRKLEDARRYYPTNPEEAFTTSDKCFFNTNKLFVVKSNLKAQESSSLGYRVGYINEKGHFVDKPGGPLKIKHFPKENWRNRYVVSCDQSKGYEEGDYSDMHVFDRVERDFVAYWNDSIPENVLAREFNKLLYFYNNGLAVPEENRRTVISLIKPDGHERYMGELYYRKPTGTTQSRKEPDWGYNMNGASRKYLLDIYLAYLEPDEFEFRHDDELDNYVSLFTVEEVDEHLHFIRDVSGNTTKYEAAQGYKDDIVIGRGLCIEGDDWWDKAPEKKYDMSERRAKSKPTNGRVRNVGSRGVRQGRIGKSGKKKYRVSHGKKSQSKLGK